ncbi:hypothetical protein PMIN06_012713 [Paraphaeosphaeria minitans]
MNLWVQEGRAAPIMSSMRLVFVRVPHPYGLQNQTLSVAGLREGGFFIIINIVCAGENPVAEQAFHPTCIGSTSNFGSRVAVSPGTSVQTKRFLDRPLSMHFAFVFVFCLFLLFSFFFWHCGRGWGKKCFLQ